jgi:hypothetical protein
LGQDEQLVPFKERADECFQNWLAWIPTLGKRLNTMTV